jgi:DNA polymerase I-like protein with 3'-5' exonuclease and polymerase domains
MSNFAGAAGRYIISANIKTSGLRATFDVEANGLLDVATTIHCVVVADLDSGRVDEYGPNQIDHALDHLGRADYLTGRNICNYDLPLFRKLHNWTPKAGCTIVDTLVASRLILPHLGRIDDQAVAMGDPSLGKLRGSHSIEAWGARLGIPKVGADIEDWSEWTPEMQERCVGDTTIGKALHHFVRPDGYSHQAIELEHRAAATCSLISANGVPFAVKAAEQLGKRWQQRCTELSTALCRQFPELKKVTRPRIITLLKERGWTPAELTEKGNPSLKNNALESVAIAYPEFAGAAEYFILDWLLGNMVRGKRAWARCVQSDGRIHAGLLHSGQPHGRASCVSPNLHGVPNPKKGAKFGVECRTLFHTPDGWVMVAADMANFQDRALAHYLVDFDGGEYVRRYLSGEDMHWSTAGALGLVGMDVARDKEDSVHTALREGAKRFRYAFLFGAQAKRLGRIIYETIRAAHNADSDLMRRFFPANPPGEMVIKNAGAQALEQFMAATPGLRQLRESIAAQVGQGWTPGLDGRRVPLLSQHTSLNYLLVSAEAVVCKRWLTQVHDELDRQFGSDAYITLWIHDEVVVCCRPGVADHVGEILVRHAKEAGEHFALRVPLDADYKIGRNWAGEPVDKPNTDLVCERIESTPENPFRDAALEYAGRGWLVFPVPPSTKKSHKSAEHSNGVAWGATRNPDEIRRDWTRWPDAGVGVVTGSESGIWVLEADTVAGHGVDGLASVTALEQHYGALPNTLMAESPSGSVHRYFKHPGNGQKIKSTDSKLALGVDIRGDGGMVVAPPSVRPGKGSYRWVNGPPIAEAPAWLLERVYEQPHEQCATEPQADSERVAAALAAITNADVGWDEWNRIGMAAWRATGGSGEGYAAFEQWSAKSPKHDAKATRERWQHYFDSPPTEIGAGTLFYLANGGGQDEAPNADAATEPPKGDGDGGATPHVAQETIEPVDLWAEMRTPPLPQELLPRVIANFAGIQGELMGCDPAGLAMGALTCCGVAIPDCVQIQPKRFDPSWLEGPRLWTGLIGYVSSMKSPMMRVITRPIRRIDAEMARAYAQAMLAYKQLDKEKKRTAEEPRHTRIRIEDATPEAIQPILRDSPDGVLLERDELAAFFGGIEKYAAGRGSAGATRGFYLQAYQGGSYNWDRITRGSGFIPNLSISILGGIQPNVIYGIADTGDDDGLIQRLCPIMLHSSGKDIDAQQPSATEAYEQLINRLHSMPRGFVAPLKFDDSALKVRERLAQKHLELAKAFEVLDSKFAAHIGKYNGLFARLCLIWHTIEHIDAGAWSGSVEAETAERVAEFMHSFLLPHAQAFYLGLLGRAKEHERLLALGGYILVHKPEFLTARDVQRGIRTMNKLDKKDVDPLFNHLEAYGWVDQIPGMRMGRPTVRWRVNPRVHELFADKAKEEAKRRAVVRQKIKETVQGRKSEL